jgi:hypothetical protein
MNANPTSPSQATHTLRARFVLVNDRVPRMDANCARCRAKIEKGYVREPHTRLVYCDAQCFTGSGKMAVSAFLNRARRAS